MKTLLLAFVFCTVCAGFSRAAEYQGQDIDGQMFDATAFSYSTGKYYSVQVDFEGDEVTIYFPRGGHRTLTLDDEVIDDPHSISAFDYGRSTHWDIDVEGLD